MVPLMAAASIVVAVVVVVKLEEEASMMLKAVHLAVQAAVQGYVDGQSGYRLYEED
jgi:hypothetical protein